VKREAVERDEERESNKRGRERTDGTYGGWSHGRGSGGVRHGKGVCVCMCMCVCVVVGERGGRVSISSKLHHDSVYTKNISRRPRPFHIQNPWELHWGQIAPSKEDPAVMRSTLIDRGPSTFKIMNFV
jgi:hypothetical protein